MNLLMYRRNVINYWKKDQSGTWKELILMKIGWNIFTSKRKFSHHQFMSNTFYFYSGGSSKKSQWFLQFFSSSPLEYYRRVVDVQHILFYPHSIQSLREIDRHFDWHVLTRTVERTYWTSKSVYHQYFHNFRQFQVRHHGGNTTRSFDDESIDEREFLTLSITLIPRSSWIMSNEIENIFWIKKPLQNNRECFKAKKKNPQIYVRNHLKIWK